MVIREIPKQGNLTIEVGLKERKLEFHTICVEAGANYIYAEPIRINGKLLSFNGNVQLSVNLVYLREEKNPIEWRGVGISTVYETGKAMYKITTVSQGFEINRRQAFRLFLGLGGVAQMGANKKAFNVIVKDVSENGFSFVGIEDMDCVGIPVRLVFNDMKMGISLMGTVVRKVVVSEKKIVYGCTLSSTNIDLMHYINEKQRLFLSMAGNKSAMANKDVLKKALREPTKYESMLKKAEEGNKTAKGKKKKK